MGGPDRGAGAARAAPPPGRRSPAGTSPPGRAAARAAPPPGRRSPAGTSPPGRTGRPPPSGRPRVIRPPPAPVALRPCQRIGGKPSGTRRCQI